MGDNLFDTLFKALPVRIPPNFSIEAARTVRVYEDTTVFFITSKFLL